MRAASGGGAPYVYNLRSMSGGSTVIRMTAPMSLVSFWPIGGRILFALVVLWGAIRFAGFCVERSWKDKAPSLGAIKREEWMSDFTFCGIPLFRQQFSRGLRETLEWNPIAWLQQYSWKARLTKWGLCLVFTTLLCMASTAATFQGISEREATVVVILAAAYTYAGVNGFLQEKKTGALELILVTPLSVNQIIFGRVWGLWKQYFPATVVLAGCYYGLRLFSPHQPMDWQPTYYGGMVLGSERFGLDYWTNYFLTDGPMREFLLIIAFFALPFYSTLAALLCRNLVIAASLTWLALLAAPIAGILLLLIPTLLQERTDSGWLYLAALGGHAVFVAMAFRNLRRRLAQRDYAF